MVISVLVLVGRGIFYDIEDERIVKLVPMLCKTGFH
jgi:hypothetical protein